MTRLAYLAGAATVAAGIVYAIRWYLDPEPWRDLVKNDAGELA